jgi:MFS family permease
MCHSVLILHLVPIAIEAGVDRVQAASLMGVMGVCQILGRVLVGVLSDRIGPKRALMAALLSQTLPVPLLWSSPSLAAFFVVAAMVGLGLGGHGTMYPLVTREYYGPKRVGLLFGTFTSGASVGMATGGLVGGMLRDLSGDYRLAILFSFATGLISLFMVLAYPRRRGKAEPAAAPESAVQPAG